MRHSHFYSLSLILGLSLITLPSIGFAGFQGSVTVQERARGAKKTVVGRVKSVAARWQTNSHGDRLIISRYDLAVEETLRGTPENMIQLDMEGGVVGNVRLTVSDLQALKIGDRAVFFVDASSSTAVYVPHWRGLGVMKLDANDRVVGNALRLDEIRRSARE